ncbi:MAG: hypothetical protein RR929_02465 [Erysipelotrichaceae bacterium]
MEDSTKKLIVRTFITKEGKEIQFDRESKNTVDFKNWSIVVSQMLAKTNAGVRNEFIVEGQKLTFEEVMNLQFDIKTVYITYRVFKDASNYVVKHVPLTEIVNVINYLKNTYPKGSDQRRFWFEIVDEGDEVLFSDQWNIDDFASELEKFNYDIMDLTIHFYKKLARSEVSDNKDSKILDLLMKAKDFIANNDL